MKQNDYFTLLLPNNKKLKFKTKECFSRANEIIATGRFANNYELYVAVKNCNTGFEYAGKVEESAKEYAKRFNNIDFEA